MTLPETSPHQQTPPRICPVSVYFSINFIYSISSWSFRSADKSTHMAANTRYQPAPQRDSFEERGYSQVPPSYEATAEGPRSEDDNVPDDFKVSARLISLIGRNEANDGLVRRDRCGGDASYSYAVHSKGVLHLVGDLFVLCNAAGY